MGRAAFVAPLLASALVLAAAPLRADHCGDNLHVTGRILQTSFPDPVPISCCFVTVTVTQGTSQRTVFARTGSDGRYSVCAPCEPGLGGPITVTAQPQCCAGGSDAAVIRECLDPVTRLGATVDLGDTECLSHSTNTTMLSGSVLCRTGVFTDPVADCPILIESFPRDTYFTRTDANGDWEACVDCTQPPGVPQTIEVTAQCCGEVEIFRTLDCPEQHQVDTMVCDTCPVPPCNDSGDIQVTGRLLCTVDPANPQPISGCTMTLELYDGCDTLQPPLLRTATTDANGFYTTCVPCRAREGCSLWFISTSTDCCPTLRNLTTVNGCPPQLRLQDDLCDSNCGPPPPGPCPTEQSEVRGRVTCFDFVTGTFVGIPDCPVLIEPAGCLDSNGDTNCDVPCDPFRVFTDANGDYTACVYCPGCQTVTATAECCNSRTNPLTLSCTDPNVLDISCGDCAPPPDPCGPTGQEVFGRVTCLDDAGNAVPVVGCTIVVDCAIGGPGPVTAMTDANGDYAACYPCAACDVLTVTAQCCGASSNVFGLGCDRVQADVACGDCDPPPPGPCDPGQEVFGRVTCTDPVTGAQVPQADCAVVVDCVVGTGGPVTVVTDATGDYAACFPCGTCDVIRATATCCGASTSAPETDCDRVPLDLDCGPCPPPRACGAQDLAEVTGFVGCSQPSPGTTPLAGCVVLLTPTTQTGVDLPPVPATTDGEGRYRACVPCSPDGLSEVTTTATCCGNVSTTTAVTGCPDTVALDDVLCDQCSPCPPAMTRLQGRVHCRGGGPVANCGVRVEVLDCSGTSTFHEAATDAQGKYVLCIPCPCPDSTVRVTAACCPGTQTVHVDDCKPVTPVPTLFCRTPCR